MSTLSDVALAHLRMVAEVPDFVETKYEILEPIGRGGMGAVFLARDRDLDRLVAIKVVGTIHSEGDRPERLLREARILARLEHPGLVPVHDVGRLHDGRGFYVMKFVKGLPLNLYIQAGTAPTERLQIFERVCDAIAFAHANGVIHRDLKPQNIMVGAFGEVLVLDWGIAKARGSADVAETGDDSTAARLSDTRDGIVLGTPGYMAPEQASGNAALADERSDIHALGSVLSFLMETETTQDTPAPKQLRAIAEKARALNPDDRYRDVPALIEDVAGYRAGLPVSAYRENLLERAGRVAYKYRLPLALVGAYVLMRAILLLVAR